MNSQKPRGPGVKRPYTLEFIPDKTLFKAVMFALRLLNDGTPVAIAIARAARDHDKSPAEVACYLGKAVAASASLGWRQR